MATPIIDPAGPLNRDGLSLPDFLGVSVEFEADQPVLWSVAGGSLFDVVAMAAAWMLPNLTGNWTISASNGVDPAGQAVVAVQAVMPNYWTFQNPITAATHQLEFEPYYGPLQRRGFGDPDSPQHKWELGNPNSDVDKFKLLRAFWRWHHARAAEFDLWDPILDERRRYQTDSDLTWSYNTAGGVDWRGRIKEAHPYALIGA